ncbi:MAG TPA: hypothetical protein VF391_01050 [Dermatophilaceae bacterium]
MAAASPARCRALGAGAGMRAQEGGHEPGQGALAAAQPLHAGGRQHLRPVAPGRVAAVVAQLVGDEGPNGRGDGE